MSSYATAKEAVNQSGRDAKSKKKKLEEKRKSADNDDNSVSAVVDDTLLVDGTLPTSGE